MNTNSEKANLTASLIIVVSINPPQLPAQVRTIVAAKFLKLANDFIVSLLPLLVASLITCRPGPCQQAFASLDLDHPIATSAAARPLPLAAFPTALADDAVKHANRTNRKYWSGAGESAEIQRHHAPVNIVGGFKWPNAPAVDLGIRPHVSAEPHRPSPSPTEGDPLAIPEFLIRFETAAPSDTG